MNPWRWVPSIIGLVLAACAVTITHTWKVVGIFVLAAGACLVLLLIGSWWDDRARDWDDAAKRREWAREFGRMRAKGEEDK